MNSGDVQHLPYSAVAMQDDALYFVKDRTVYRRRLTFQSAPLALDGAFSGDPLEVVASDKVLHLAPRDGCVWLATERGLFAAEAADVRLAHKWDDLAIRVQVCGEAFLATGVGPEVQIYDTRSRVASRAASSSKNQVIGLDAQCLSRGDGGSRGVLVIVGENGRLDVLELLN
jgi:hypothetical protein